MTASVSASNSASRKEVLPLESSQLDSGLQGSNVITEDLKPEELLGNGGHFLFFHRHASMHDCMNIHVLCEKDLDP